MLMLQNIFNDTHSIVLEIAFVFLFEQQLVLNAHLLY